MYTPGLYYTQTPQCRELMIIYGTRLGVWSFHPPPQGPLSRPVGLRGSVRQELPDHGPPVLSMEEPELEEWSSMGVACGRPCGLRGYCIHG